MDLGGWLRSLGLDQYEATFRANEIDTDVLPELTEIDLEKRVPLGHRKRLLKAIAGLAAPEKLPPTLGPAPERPETDAAERRQVTVMFSDLVGSTALSARMDPEDLREVISAYQKCVAETVRRFRGFVAKYMGDGVLVYFGYPQAHEDDAEQAVRAGLELIAAVASLKTRAALQTRIGIATGLVVVGDLIGSGAAQEQAIVGETPNLAARLQGIAQPNIVVIGESTRRLLGNLFELEDLGAQELKGIAPTRAFAALRASSAEGRFEALHASDVTALVGREEETELLLRRWAKAKAARPGGAPFRRGRHRQIPAHRSAAGKARRRVPHALALFLLATAHRQRALSDHRPDRACGRTGARRHLASETRQARYAARADRDLCEDAALFAEMLSLPNDGRYPALELTPQQRRQRTMDALITQMRR